MRGLVAVLALGCGRIDFAPLDASTTAGDSGGSNGGGDGMTCTSGSWSTPMLVANVNGAWDVLHSTLSANALELYLSIASSSTAGVDLFVATRTFVGLPFGAPTPITGLNTAGNDESFTLTPDGVIAYFTSDSTGTWRLYQTSRNGGVGPFMTSGVLPNVSELRSVDLAPVGGEMFAMLLNPTEGDLVQVIDWDAPNPIITFLDDQITVGNEGSPSVSTDGLTLYYTDANGDIARATRTAIGTLPFVSQGVEAELSTASLETSVDISYDGRELFLTRVGASWSELYVATRGCP